MFAPLPLRSSPCLPPPTPPAPPLLPKAPGSQPELRGKLPGSECVRHGRRRGRCRSRKPRQCSLPSGRTGLPKPPNPPWRRRARKRIRHPSAPAPPRPRRAPMPRHPSGSDHPQKRLATRRGGQECGLALSIAHCSRRTAARPAAPGCAVRFPADLSSARSWEFPFATNVGNRHYKGKTSERSAREPA